MSPPSEKVRGTRPPCPPPNCAHDWTSYGKWDLTTDNLTTDSELFLTALFQC